MAKFDPEHATVPETDFRDRNSAERFLECGKFKDCRNLLLPLVHQDWPPVNIYVPVCGESRFNKIGIAKDLPMPNPGSREISAVVYNSVGTWAPLISCPSDCKGYRSTQPAPPPETVQPRQDEQPETVQPNATDNLAPRRWSRDQKIGLGILIFAVLAILVSLVVPEVRRFFGFEREPSYKWITGIVVDKQNNRELSQVLVTVVGRGKSTTTRDDGSFRISLPADSPSVVFLRSTKVGYVPYETDVQVPSNDIKLPMQKQ